MLMWYFFIGGLVILLKIVVDALYFKRSFIKDTGDKTSENGVFTLLLNRGLKLPDKVITLIGLLIMWILYPVVLIGLIYQVINKITKPVIVEPEKKLIRHEPKHKEITPMTTYVARLRQEVVKSGVTKVYTKTAQTIRYDMQTHAKRQIAGTEPNQTLPEVIDIFNSDKDWHKFCVEIGITDAKIIEWYKEFRK